MFPAPMVEDDVLNLSIKVKGKFYAVYDEIPEQLVKDSIQFIITCATSLTCVLCV
jgi:hypothetical protein